MLKNLKSKILNFLDSDKARNALDNMKFWVWLFVGTGWSAAYTISTNHDSKWTESDSVLTYSVNMFAVVVFGFLFQVLFLFTFFMLLTAIAAFFIYGWFVALPLTVIFVGICVGRWHYLRKRQRQAP